MQQNQMSYSGSQAQHTNMGNQVINGSGPNNLGNTFMNNNQNVGMQAHMQGTIG